MVTINLSPILLFSSNLSNFFNAYDLFIKLDNKTLKTLIRKVA